LAQGWGFAHLIRASSTPPPARVLLIEVYFRGMLARYLPGKVGIPAVRMASAARLSVGPGFMAASVVVETLAWLASGFVLTLLLTLGPWAPAGMSELWKHPLAKVSVAAALAGSLVLATLGVRRYPARLLRLLRLERREGPLLPPALLVASSLYWVGTACASVALAVALGVGLDSALLVAIAGMASLLVSFLALPVPAGLGVREAVIVMVLSSTLSAPVALAFGLLSRGLMLGIELVLWLISKLVAHRWRPSG
jgi:uncharacterized membrane protein YbhN (UPF0104 family)